MVSNGAKAVMVMVAPAAHALYRLYRWLLSRFHGQPSPLGNSNQLALRKGVTCAFSACFLSKPLGKFQDRRVSLILVYLAKWGLVTGM